jgi:hypothetical protein
MVMFVLKVDVMMQKRGEGKKNRGRRDRTGFGGGLVSKLSEPLRNYDGINGMAL